MFCSKCGDPITPVVAVDLDGTLADFHGHFITFLLAYFDKTALPMDHDYQGGGPGTFRAFCQERFDLTDKDWHDAKLAYRQGGQKRTMPIRDGAEELCDAIHQEGAELWVTTTRPYLSLDTIVPDTVEWLRRHQIEYDGMLFDEFKYVEFARRIDTHRVVAVLDDLQEMCEAAAEIMYFGSDVPILVENDYNDKDQWHVKRSLHGAVAIVRERIHYWNDVWAKEHQYAH